MLLFARVLACTSCYLRRNRKRFARTTRYVTALSPFLSLSLSSSLFFPPARDSRRLDAPCDSLVNFFNPLRRSPCRAVFSPRHCAAAAAVTFAVRLKCKLARGSAGALKQPLYQDFVAPVGRATAAANLAPPSLPRLIGIYGDADAFLFWTGLVVSVNISPTHSFFIVSFVFSTYS